jgi:hypothetical protein
MICHLQGSIFSVQSIDGSERYNIDFGKPIWVTTARLSPNRRMIAVVGSDNFTAEAGEPIIFKSPPKLWVIDLDTLRKTELAVGVADDVLWVRDENTLLYSTGGEIVGYDMKTGVRFDDYRFSRIRQGTNSLGLNSDGSKVSFLLWKRDARHIGVYDFDKLN